jgi:hypothetical protein
MSGKTTTITIRLSSEEVSRLDEMRGAGVSRSAFVRELLRRSGPVDDQPSYPEALRLLARSARAGKVQAQVALERAVRARNPRMTVTGLRGCSMAPTSELERFQRVADGVGLRLEDFQLEVMDAVLSDRREVTITQPRGAGKTTLLGCYALWELVRHPEATIIAAASARDQAQHVYRAAVRFAKQVPALRDRLTFTLREIRTPHDGRLVVSPRTPRSRWDTIRIS